MKYCRKCVLPDTRPGITLRDDGVCSACLGHLEKTGEIDWAARARDLEEIIANTKRRAKGYDCVIPVSGGKDSTWQVAYCLERGLRPLAVTWRTPGRTALGQQNLDNLIRLGVDHIDYSIDPDVERRFMYNALVRVGDTAIPMHMAIFSIPLRIAVAFDIPLVVWGESPHMEYGGSQADRVRNTLDFAWLRRHGILQGTSMADWVDQELTAKRLEAYRLPDEADFQAHQIQSIFLGFYVPWDPVETARVAKTHGFQARDEGARVGYYAFADIDCAHIAVHHYFKWLKFGFTRLFDNLSLEIRNGRMSREQAVALIASTGDQTPHADIANVCEFLRISRQDFWDIAERYRNPAVWSRQNDTWVIEDFIIREWNWS